MPSPDWKRVNGFFTDLYDRSFSLRCPESPLRRDFRGKYTNYFRAMVSREVLFFVLMAMFLEL
jgi:hypothetical protein